MANQLQFELVSPEKLVISQPVAMVTVPGGEGDFGVLPGHAPIIATVRPGVIEIYGQDDTTISERIFVAGGFAEVTDARCTVLAEEAVHVSELNRADLEMTAKDLSEDIGLAKTDHARALLEAQFAVVTAKLQVAA